MGSLSSPQTWLPYDKIKDCSQGICSLYCPQWCNKIKDCSQGICSLYCPQWCDKIKDCSQGICSLYCPQWCFLVHHPPPPPFGFSDDYDDSKTTLSPFIIVMIGILASAFLLVSYYTIISKYCGNFDLFRRRTSRNQIEEFNENQNPSQQEPWQVLTRGLDEALIKSIMVCKYKKGDGLVQGTDCSVCLGEFQEDECLRLLPKCSHAFHVTCIDTWLKSHTNCPLCRANIVSTTPSQRHEVPPQVPQNPSESEPSLQTQHENHGVDVVEASETDGEAVIPSSNIALMTPLRILQELEDLDGRDTMLEIRDEGNRKVKRSASLDSSCQSHISVFDILCSSEDDDDQTEDHDQQFQMGILGSSSKQHVEEHSKSKSSRSFHCDISPTTMKRSFSSGRFLFIRNGRGRNAILPL